MAVCSMQGMDQPKEIHARDGAGETALHRAAKAGDAQKVLQLLAQHADPNAINEAGETPLSLAVYGAHAKVVKALLTSTALLTNKSTKLCENMNPREYAQKYLCCRPIEKQRVYARIFYYLTRVYKTSALAKETNHA